MYWRRRAKGLCADCEEKATRGVLCKPHHATRLKAYRDTIRTTPVNHCGLCGNLGHNARTCPRVHKHLA